MDKDRIQFTAWKVLTATGLIGLGICLGVPFLDGRGGGPEIILIVCSGLLMGWGYGVMTNRYLVGIGIGIGLFGSVGFIVVTMLAQLANALFR